MAVYKRSIFLINPKFQIKFSLIVCSLIYLSSLIYPITIVELYNSFAQVSPQAKEAMTAARNELVTFLAIYQFLFVAIVFVICVFLTHKVAGPMYKLTNYLRNIRNGAQPTRISFRDGDNFSEVADEVNEVFDYLADAHDTDYAYLTEVTSYIKNLALVVPEDKKPVLQEITARLKDIQTRLKPQD